MDIWKSVFSVDHVPLDTSTEGRPPSDFPPKSREEEDDGITVSVVVDPKPTLSLDCRPNTSWVGLGGLVKTIAFKSESVIQTYRRELEEFGTALKQETVAIRQVASRVARDLPSSLEASLSVAQESLESVGDAIDEFGGSVWRSTSEIISQGKEALLSAELNANAFGLKTPSSAGVTALSSKWYSRFEAQVFALQADLSTFTDEPMDVEDFRKWVSEFKLEEKEKEIETLCYDNRILEGLFEKLVPSVVDYDTFWTRYFYKFNKLKRADDVRANLVKRIILREDEDKDLTWEVDDDGKEEENETGKEGQVQGEEGTIQEREANADNRDEGRDKQVEMEEKFATKVIESDNGKKLHEIPVRLSPGVDAMTYNEKTSSSILGTAYVEQASNSDEKVFPSSKSELVESCKDSEICTVISQPSMPEEEDVGWDEIEDLGDQDDNKVGIFNSSHNRENLCKKLSVAEDDEDLNWDIEDED